MLLPRHISRVKKSPRIAPEGVASLCGALVKKLRSQFQVVRIEEVFQTAVEVDGAPIREEAAESRLWNPQLQRVGESLAGIKACHTRKRVTVSRQTVVLCIDDNTTALNIRQMLLQAKGFVVRTATDGRSGLEITDNEPVDAVILDYQMPGMNGEEVARHLRARHPNIPILLLTGLPGLVPESLISMVDAFVEKGRPAALLVAELERLTRVSVSAGAEERRPA